LGTALSAHRRGREPAQDAFLLIDGEAVVCDEKGLAVFEQLRRKSSGKHVSLCFRPARARRPGSAARAARDAQGDAREPAAWEPSGAPSERAPRPRRRERIRHACKMGLEGIVSKRKDSAYRSGRSPDWLKMENPEASAVKREEDEEWGKKKRR
jgi:bifunctional non-homologous end joining protein LigD